MSIFILFMLCVRLLCLPTEAAMERVQILALLSKIHRVFSDFTLTKLLDSKCKWMLWRSSNFHKPLRKPYKLINTLFAPIYLQWPYHRAGLQPHVHWISCSFAYCWQILVVNSNFMNLFDHDKSFCPILILDLLWPFGNWTYIVFKKTILMIMSNIICIV